MLSYFKQYHWTKIDSIFVCILLAFVACKIPFLSTSFFYDESWSYCHAIRKMGETIPSILPGAIDIADYKGHPLLFYALSGVWQKMFGHSNISLHSYALCYGIGLLIICYAILKKTTKPLLTILGIILIAVQGFVFVQSSTIMPEIAIAFFSLCTIYFFISRQWKAYFLVAACLLLTKESGLVMIPSICVGYSIQAFVVNNSFKMYYKNMLKILAPILIIIVFYILQYAKYGYFLYPDHVGYMNTEFSYICYRFHSFCNYLSEESYHYYYTIGVKVSLLFAILLWIVWRKNWLQRFPIIVKWFLSKTATSNWQLKFIFYSLLYVFFYLVFSAINFYSARYLITPLVTLIIVLCIVLEKIIGAYANITIGALVILFGVLLITNKRLNEESLGVYDFNEVCSKGVAWFQQNVDYNTPIRIDDFILRTQLINYRAGFLSDTFDYKKVVLMDENGFKYRVISSLADSASAIALHKDTSYQLIQQYNKNLAWYQIWQKK
jgi:Dolichyl-phosphate-mannose-protein mannosyltransferase